MYYSRRSSECLLGLKAPGVMLFYLLSCVALSLVRPRLEYAAQLRSSHHKTWSESLESSEALIEIVSAFRLSRVGNHSGIFDSLSLSLWVVCFVLEKTLRGDLTQVFRNLKNLVMPNISSFCSK